MPTVYVCSSPVRQVADTSHDEDEAEQLSPRRRLRGEPLIRIERHEPDLLTKTLLGAAVSLLAFICWSSWGANRELGQISEAQNALRSEQQITNGYFERRLAVLESIVQRLAEKQ